MPRELGDERSRYGRKGLREQASDILAWPGSHHFATGVIAVVIVGAVLLSASAGFFADPRRLAVGDCLFVRTDTPADDPHPIGDAQAVAKAVIDGNAQTAGCNASHGHEVSALVGLSGAEAACDAAFRAYVGRPLEGSRYVTFPAVPTAEARAAGASSAICLVARTDGQWMDHPARGSGE